jgi:predicted transcriptional regulator YheO
MYKSTTIGITGSENRLIGMLCINFQLNAPFMDIISNLALPSNLVAGHLLLNNQNNNHGYEATLYETIQSTKEVVMNNPDIPPKFKRKEIIRRLYEAGVFEIKNGVAMCAELLGVTITTIYMHIRNFDEANAQRS